MSIVQRLKDLFRRKPVPDEKLEKLAAAESDKATANQRWSRIG